MVRAEELRGHPPDEAIKELPKPEVGKRAAELIKDFKQVLKITPEFVRVLPACFFDEGGANFIKGDFRYQVEHGKGRDGSESLLIYKELANKEARKKDDYIEMVDLSTTVKNNRFEGGFIEHKKLYTTLDDRSLDTKIH